MLIAAAVTALIAAALSISMRPSLSGSPLIFIIPAVPYALLTVLAVRRLRRDGTLSEKLRPRSGDLTFGVLVTVMLFFGAIAVRRFLAPSSSVQEGWVMRVYLQIGNPEVLQERIVTIGVSVAVVIVAALEEISWRGYVYTVLEERLGTRRAWPVTAVLYAVAHLPTLLLLRDPFAGLNPLVVFAALGCGLVWGLVVARTGRLPVAIFSHASFTWCVAIQFPLWRLS